MGKLIFLILITCCINCLGFQTGDPEIKKINGKNYITYQVESGDGWYAIAKKFGISYVELRLANKEKDDKLFPGLKILIPANKLKANDSFYQKNIPEKQISIKPETGNEKYHIVAKTQTLFSIAKMYGVTVTQLKEWNNLSSNSISIGQKLIVGESVSKEKATGIKPELFKEEEKPEEIPIHDTVSQLTEKTDLINNHSDTSLITSKVETEYVNYQRTVPPVVDENVNNIPSSGSIPASDDTSTGKIIFANNRREVIENGIAVVMEDEESGPEKYFALHGSAPIGTIIRVLNMSNSRKIYVKITGKLADNAGVEGAIIKISKASAEKLDVTEKKFRVNLIYGVSKE